MAHERLDEVSRAAAVADDDPHVERVEGLSPLHALRGAALALAPPLLAELLDRGLDRDVHARPMDAPHHALGLGGLGRRLERVGQIGEQAGPARSVGQLRHLCVKGIGGVVHDVAPVGHHRGEGVVRVRRVDGARRRHGGAPFRVAPRDRDRDLGDGVESPALHQRAELHRGRVHPHLDPGERVVVYPPARHVLVESLQPLGEIGEPLALHRLRPARSTGALRLSLPQLIEQERAHHAERAGRQQPLREEALVTHQQRGEVQARHLVVGAGEPQLGRHARHVPEDAALGELGQVLLLHPRPQGFPAVGRRRVLPAIPREGPADHRVDMRPLLAVEVGVHVHGPQRLQRAVEPDVVPPEEAARLALGLALAGREHGSPAEPQDLLAMASGELAQQRVHVFHGEKSPRGRAERKLSRGRPP